MKGSRRIPAVHIAGMLTLLAIVSLAVWVVSDGRSPERNVSDRDTDRSKTVQSAPPRHAENPPVEAAPSVPPVSAEKVEGLGRIAKRFVSAQYDRDPRLTVEQLRDRLSSVVTDGYLLRYPPTLSTESDEWVKRERGTIVARSVVEAPDGMISETEALVYADVIVQGEAKDETLPPYSFTIRLRMVWERGWKVDDVV